MVTLDKIYTRGGDDGETSLVGGVRVPKHDLRIAAFGTVDETNALLGVARLHVKGDEETEVADMILGRIQNDLFDLGADLARPLDDSQKNTESKEMRITQGQIDRLEGEIDDLNKILSPLTSFILPGGTAAASHLHVARTVTRRAERLTTELAGREGLNPLVLIYLNRLSDHLFVLARYLNDNGKSDILWQPGDNR
ncbi:MAG: cob(I)yrinic acid a,c-diamide adenosyltransferase [Rhodospirillales bacterium]|jgi:cob(I)alamin adenosyltransferase|nr:cob(I)yrinic acid a,c-diamide adenosyltransferase [Rhodospirillales bacterium]